MTVNVVRIFLIHVVIVCAFTCLACVSSTNEIDECANNAPWLDDYYLKIKYFHLDDNYKSSLTHFFLHQECN